MSNALITGDFNYPHIDWKNLNNNSGTEQAFIDYLQDLFLQQSVTKPTRNLNGQSKTLLDIILTNDDNILQNIQHSAPLGKSDHDVGTIYPL